MSPMHVQAPSLIVFDVNETLSDMSPLDGKFATVGLPPDDREAWFAGLLRDGFSLTSVGENPDFAQLAAESLRLRLQGRCREKDLDQHVDTVIQTFGQLGVHRDVVAGIRSLRSLGIRLVTLSNGSTSVAEALLERAGITDAFEKLMSVADGPAWKPAAGSYRRALEVCGVLADEAMLVAVHPWDIDGAARAGMRTGWLRRSAAGYPSYFRAPEVEVADLRELAVALS